MKNKNINLEELQNKISSLETKQEKIKQEINNINLKLNELLKQKGFYREEKEKLAKQLCLLYDKNWNIQEEIDFLKRQITYAHPSYTNGIIDLYLDFSSDSVSDYIITLSGSTKEIGNVRINWEDVDMFGNIGCSLYQEYRGNHYMIQALELLKKPMIEKGLTKPHIMIEPGNISSIKSVEQFGGVLIKESDDEQFWNTYEVDLLDSKKSKNR